MCDLILWDDGLFVIGQFQSVILEDTGSLIVVSTISRVKAAIASIEARATLAGL